MIKIGLVAGVGRLPCEFAKIARNYGMQVVAVAVVNDVDPELKTLVSSFYQAHIGAMGKVIDIFKKEGISKVTMIGKVTKEGLFSGLFIPDWRTVKVLASLPNRNDDTLMLAVVNEFAKDDITIMDQSKLLSGLFPKIGVLSKRQPTEQELIDIEYGYEMALRIGQLDIGQTVVVKDQAIMAVEAIEGTDECVKRGGKLANGNAVVAKTAKPQQDSRFDLPTVGTQTIQSMIEGGASALVMQAEKTFLVDRESVLELANEHAICIVVK